MKNGVRFAEDVSERILIDFGSLLGLIFGRFLGEADMYEMHKNLQVFAHFKGSGASGKKSKIDVFWKSFWKPF